MLLGLKWYWWLILTVIFILSLPLKVIFVKWWSRHRSDKERQQKDKWGKDHDRRERLALFLQKGP